MLVKFVSIVDAVRCAADIQRGMVEHNAPNRYARVHNSVIYLSCLDIFSYPDIFLACEFCMTIIFVIH